jgi:hypothetical protein
VRRVGEGEGGVLEDSDALADDEVREAFARAARAAAAGEQARRRASSDDDDDDEGE